MPTTRSIFARIGGYRFIITRIIKEGDIGDLTFENENTYAFMNVYQAINSNSRYTFVLEFFVESTELII